MIPLVGLIFSELKLYTLKGRQIIVGNGITARFWEDHWISSKPLSNLFPILYGICHDKEISLFSASNAQWNLSFRRWFNQDLQRQWDTILSWVHNLHLNDKDDMVVWAPNKTGMFIVKSVYNWLVRDSPIYSFAHIWKAKIPLKIKKFICLLEKNALLTKGNMIKRKWSGDGTCCFCTQREMAQHLFFLCPISKVVWGVVATCIGANSIPNSIHQFHMWISIHLAYGKLFYVIDLAVICCAIWKARNKACFER